MEKVLNKILIIDGSFLIHRSLKVDTLWELKSSRTGQRTGGIFGFLRSLNYEFRKYDYYPVVCWDSGLAERRTQAYPFYKHHNLREAEHIVKSSFRMDESAGNPSDPDEDIFRKISEKLGANKSALDEAMESAKEMLARSRVDIGQFFDPDDYRAQYHRQRGVLINILNALGVPSIKIEGWEGDDLMVLLQRMSKQSIIMTDDKDLIQMIAPNTDILRPMQKQYLKYDEYLKEQGATTAREFCIVKAIVGDGSDNIPGVTSGLERKYALGATRAVSVARIIIENDEDPEKYLPAISDLHKNYYDGFVMRHDDYLRNMELVDLALVPDDEDVMRDILAEVTAHAGKCNLMSALSLLSEQEITSFDVNGFISKMSVLSCAILNQGG